MVTFGRATNFTRFVLIQVHKFHLKKHSHYLYLYLLHVKSQTVSFFSFPLKYINEFIIAHLRATRTTSYIPCIVYNNTTNNQLKMYNFTIHTALFFSFSLLTQTAQWRCVCTACYCLTEFTTYMSIVRCRQFTTLQNVATVLSCQYKDLTSSHRFACSVSGNVYV